jgi:hypothetical protein
VEFPKPAQWGRGTTNKNLRIKNWRGAYSVLTEHRRNPLLSKTNNNFGLI